MGINLIDKIVPKNDGFTGLVDADQVLGGGTAGTLPTACETDPVFVASVAHGITNVGSGIVITDAERTALHAAVTIGTANGLSLSTQALSMALADTNTTGALSDTDWDTFNGKQAGDASLTSISGLTYVSGSFIALTAADTYVVRTYAQTLSDIGAAPALGGDDNYVTDTEKTVIGNTSGSNTGDQDLSGLALKTTTISAGTGLTGGGDLSANRTIALSHLGIQSLADPNADTLMGWDDTDGLTKFLTIGTNLSYDHATHTLSASGGGGAATGTIIAWGGADASPPTGYLECDGASLLRASYADLFGVIGVMFGTVDGTHFTLPNLEGKFARGANAATNPGGTGGTATHTHTGPSHTHTGPSHTHTIAHTHTYSGTTSTYGMCGFSCVDSGTDLNVLDIQAASWEHNHTYSGTTEASSAANSGAGGTGATGAGGTQASGSAGTLPNYQDIKWIIKT